MDLLRKVLSAKIHRATVTEADVDYEGSITIPPHLMEAAGLVEYEAVQVWNVTNGNRLETYAIRGVTGTNDICVNGAAARLVNPGDLVIIACFMHIPQSELAGYRPKLVFVDDRNQIIARDREVPGPGRFIPAAA